MHPRQKKSIRITTTDINLERLVEITKLMSKEMRGAFNKMYGRILDLLDISVKTPVISALAQFGVLIFTALSCQILT
ncbi:hypothetical protein SESBI_23102 [Sesbania bispinosa]|nr:hypothetical protein SESBI_23102 [Sesbania bispinosa]